MISAKRQPTAQMSTGRPQRVSPTSSSGARYQRVATQSVYVSPPEDTRRANPKSHSLITPWLDTKMFSGLTSRCTICRDKSFTHQFQTQFTHYDSDSIVGYVYILIKKRTNLLNVKINIAFRFIPFYDSSVVLPISWMMSLVLVPIQKNCIRWSIVLFDIRLSTSDVICETKFYRTPNCRFSLQYPIYVKRKRGLNSFYFACFKIK